MSRTYRVTITTEITLDDGLEIVENKAAHRLDIIDSRTKLLAHPDLNFSVEPFTENDTIGSEDGVEILGLYDKVVVQEIMAKPVDRFIPKDKAGPRMVYYNALRLGA